MIEPKQDVVDGFGSRPTIAKRWECSLETIRRKEKAGILTPYKIGGLTRYKMSQVLAIENEAAVK
jgi:hypothetical protein